MKVRSIAVAALACVASGVVASAYLDVFPLVGATAMWMVVPVTLMFCAAVLFDIRVAVPRLLLRRRYAAYVASVMAMAYAASVAAYGMEYAVRAVLRLPSRISDYGSAWLWADAFSNSMLLLLIMLGAGAGALYRKWSADAEAERALGAALDRYMGEVRRRLDPAFIAASLDGVARCIAVDASRAAAAIRELSGYLRCQLYELPPPPLPAGDAGLPDDYSALSAFMVGHRSRALRHVLFQLVLAAISFGTFFTAPDSPDFAGRLAGVAVVYVMLNALAYIDVLWLFPRFRRGTGFRRHCIEISVMILTFTLPLVTAQMLTYDQNLYDKQLPPLIVAAATLGSLVTLFLFVGGISAVMFCQDWLRGQRRMILLRAETARQEYAFLRKQINPHFLFNVLNNIGILSADEPAEATRMIECLRRLMALQLSATGSSTTTVGAEAEFLRAYLTLAATRIDSLRFTFGVSPGLSDTVIPSLLFIPLVENAVKYSVPVHGRRSVHVRISAVQNRLLFESVNSYDPRRPSDLSAGGVGLANTRRRLELLYAHRFTYAVSTTACSYKVRLLIPVSISE